MISIVLYGRNDTYGYNLHKRAALSLNCMAEVLTAEHDEIIFVDYNTPDDYPTFPEAIADTLTVKCRGMLRVLRIRPDVHDHLFARQTHLKALESVSRNAAVRRSNPQNKWILSTNTDMIFIPRDGQSLSNPVGRLDGGFYCAPRLEIPETAWEDFDRMNAPGVMATVRALGAEIHLDEIVRGEDAILYDGPGDFQLIQREDLFHIDGFHEGMLLGWHVDANISKRLTLLHGRVGDAAPFVFGYHCDHTRQVTPAHSHESPENDPETFIHSVNSPDITAQRDNWGLAGIDLEEIKLVEGCSKAYLRALRSAIKAPLEHPTRSDYRSDGFDRQLARADHILPFLVDLFASRPRDVQVAWLGAHGAMLDLFINCWNKMGFLHPVATCASSRKSDESAAAILDAADILVMNFGVPETLTPIQHAAQLDEYWQAILGEADRITAGAKPRQIIAINAIHNRYESLVKTHLNCAKTPFSTRLRHGYLNKAALVSDIDWTDAMTVGKAGTRAESGIATNGQTGHIVYGPYRHLQPGTYEVAVRVRVRAPGRAKRSLLKKGTAMLTLETVLDEIERVSNTFELATGTHTLRQRVDVTSSDSFKTAQIRLHNGNSCKAFIETVQLHRAPASALARAKQTTA